MKGLKFTVFCSLVITIPTIAQYKVIKLDPPINSEYYDEISPIVTRNGKTLYFTRVAAPDFCRTLIQDDVDISKTYTEAEYFNELKNIYSQIAGRYIEDPFASPINQEIVIADTKVTAFDQVYQPGYPINNALPNSVCSLAPDDQSVIVINHFYRDGSMQNGFSISTRQAENEFTFPEPIFIQDFHTLSPEVNFNMSKDADVILLSLNRINGFGESDLYVCFKLKENLWSEPLNLGSGINTEFRESTPYLSDDKTRLFYASNRPGGKGGTDIYVSRRLDYTWRRWSKPQLLVEPINSSFDDSHPSFVESTGNLYFTSRRDGTSDIYSVNIEVVEKIEAPITLRGVIKHAVTKLPLEYSTIQYASLRDMGVAQFTSGIDGKFEIKFDKKETFRLSPHKLGFVGKNQLVDLNILAQNNIITYDIEFYLTPIDGDQKVDVAPIYFERGTSKIVQASYDELDRLAELLIQNPTVKIRVEGHTDSVGKMHELLDLSRSRADSIKKYLVLRRDIGSNRINTVGYGGLRPISPNDTEENRAKNRRVEIYVEAMGAVRNKIKMSDLPDPKVTMSKDIVDFKKDKTIIPEKAAEDNKSLSSYTSESAKADIVPGSANTSQIKLNVYGRILFHENTLAIQESSFTSIRKLVDYLTANPAVKIVLIGHSSTKDEKNNTEVYAQQRARGVKEYLIFKSIASDRIRFQENITNATWAGVQVMTLK